MIELVFTYQRFQGKVRLQRSTGRSDTDNFTLPDGLRYGGNSCAGIGIMSFHAWLPYTVRSVGKLVAEPATVA